MIFQEKLKSKEKIFLDGGNGSEIARLGGDMSPAFAALATINSPDIVVKVHENFINAGCDIITANTFATNRHNLDSLNYSDKTDKFILKSVELAKKALSNTGMDNKIGIANAEYSFITEPHSSGVFTSLTDGSQVINFIRENSTALDFPKNKLILAGVSAGAGIALWNGFREETNSEVKGIVGLYAQSTYDINKWEAIFPDLNLDSIKEVNSEIRDLYTQFYGGEYTAEKAMDLDFLSEIDADDPTLYLYNPVYKDEVISEGILDLDVLFHSFKHADLLRKKTTEVGLECSGAYQELPQEFIERILIDQ